MKRPGRWPLLLIAAPAAVAIWSGWVGLGGLCGFGPVNLAPGIGGGFTLNTAITLPVGVEAYAAFALGVWISDSGDISDTARKFAKWSAIGALAYGMLGQVTYHLLAAAHLTAAPWPVVVGVSCMPVAVLGFAAALTHLLRAEDVAGEPEESSPLGFPATQPGTVPADAEHAARLALEASAAAGNPLSQRQLVARFGITRTAERTMRQQVIGDSPAGAPPAGDGGRDGDPNPPVPATLNGRAHD